MQNIQVNFNRCATCRLLNVSEETLNSVPTIVKMRALFDNYEMDASVNEIVTDQEIQEENDFITALLKTEVMKTLMKFLSDKGLLKFKSIFNFIVIQSKKYHRLRWKYIFKSILSTSYTLVYNLHTWRWCSWQFWI